MPQHKPAYRLTVYSPRSVDPAEATILTPIGGAAHSDPFKVTTLPNLVGYKPYLQPPTGRSGRMDTLTKRTDQGVLTFRVLDPQIGATKTTRWLAAFSGDARGRLRLGNLKAFAEESLDGGTTWTPFWTGRIRQVRDDVVAVDLVIRELADDLQALAFVGRPHPDVTYASFPTLLPVAASAIAYGTQPAVTPLVGTTANASQTGTGFGKMTILLDAASIGRADNIVTSNLLEVAGPASDNPFDDFFALTPFSGPGRVRLKRLDTQATGYFKIGRFGPGVKAGGHAAVRSLIVQELRTDEVGYLAIPPNSTSVEVWVEAEHYATEDTPLFIGDVHPVTLWKHLLEGKFGYRWTPPETLPPGKSYGDPRIAVPYDTAAFATLEADDTIPKVRFIVKKREKRGEWITKNLLPAAHLGYYLDANGKVVPVDLRLPSDVSSAPTITDADLLAMPDWDFDRSKAITRVDGAYYRDLPIAVSDLNASPEYSPKISGGGFKEIRHPISVIDLGNTDLGDAPHDLDIAGFRYMEGEQLQAQPRAEYLQRQITRLATETARPFGYGAPELVLRCKRGSAGDARPGEIRKVDVDSVLDPLTNVRGGTRVIRVNGREEKGPAVETRGIDLGIPTIADAPTLGVPAQETGNTRNGVTVSVTLNAAGDPVEIHYAVTDTGVGSAPAETSPLWTPRLGGVVKTTSTAVIRPVPAGSRIWVRGRSFPITGAGLTLPSVWVAASSPGRVDTAALFAPNTLASSNIKARSFRVTWANGETGVPVEILLATPTTDPRIVVARLPGDSTLYDFPGNTWVNIQPSTTYRVGLRHAQDSPASVSPEATIDVTTTSEAPVLRPPTLLSDAGSTPAASTNLRA